MGKFGLAYRRFLNYSVTTLSHPFGGIYLYSWLCTFSGGCHKNGLHARQQDSSILSCTGLHRNHEVAIVWKVYHQFQSETISTHRLLQQFPKQRLIEMGFLMVTIKDNRRTNRRNHGEVRQFANTLTEAELRLKNKPRGGMSGKHHQH